jgi:hypothetical protein
MLLKYRLIGVLLSAITACGFVPSVQAHEAAHADSLRMDAAPAPLAARYVVTVDRASNPQPRSQPTLHTWYFYRDAEQVALLKGNVDEVWSRDVQQRVRFMRVFHDDARVVDYSTGELLTLHVNADWTALSSFVDPSELAQLKRVSVQGQGRDTRWRLTGWLRQGSMQAHVTVDWLPALQLPKRLVRQIKDGTTVRMTLVETSAQPLPSWPLVGARASNYLHLDAADFGDMDYDPVVRKSEALDARLGWRASHQHD